MIIGSFHSRRRWLSNFYYVTITYKGEDYPSVEHAYQAAKATNEVDRRYVQKAAGSAAARRRGREIPCRGDFYTFNEWLMLKLLHLKFQDSSLRQKLVLTHPHELIHGNTHGDEFWGINRRTGDGQNKLGKQLMLLRDLIREGTDDTVLLIAQRKVKKKALDNARRQRIRDQIAAAAKKPPSMKMVWDDKKIACPSVRARHKVGVKVQDAINGMKGPLEQKRTKKETREWLKRFKRETS